MKIGIAVIALVSVLGLIITWIIAKRGADKKYETENRTIRNLSLVYASFFFIAILSFALYFYFTL